MTDPTSDRTTLARAVKAAGKKIRILPKKQLNQSLEWACGDMADAYRCGVEEAQGEIVNRLRQLGVTS